VQADDRQSSASDYSSTLNIGADIFLRNVGWIQTDYTALYPTGVRASHPAIWSAGNSVNRVPVDESKMPVVVTISKQFKRMSRCLHRLDCSLELCIRPPGDILLRMRSWPMLSYRLCKKAQGMLRPLHVFWGYDVVKSGVYIILKESAEFMSRAQE
jgi:hypothetical protein